MFVDLLSFIFQNFLSPFANPELVESYKIAAQHAVYNKVDTVHLLSEPIPNWRKSVQWIGYCF